MTHVKFTLHITDFRPTFCIKEVESTHEAFRIAQNFMFGRATWEVLDVSIVEIEEGYLVVEETKIASFYGRNKKQDINGEY